MATRTSLASSFGLLPIVLLLWFGAPAHADPLRPGDILRVSFNMGAYEPPPALETLDVLDFTTGLTAIESIGFYTARVFNGDELLGSYTAAFDPGAGVTVSSYFRASTSSYAVRNPTVIDFSSFNQGTFDGAVELTIDSGLARWFRVSEGLALGRALNASTYIANLEVYPDQHAFWEIIPGTQNPIPEPSSMLLLGTGAAVLIARIRRT